MITIGLLTPTSERNNYKFLVFDTFGNYHVLFHFQKRLILLYIYWSITENQKVIFLKISSEMQKPNISTLKLQLLYPLF